MEQLIFTFVQVICGQEYPMGFDLSTKQEEIKTKAERTNSRIATPPPFTLNHVDQENDFCYLLTCNLVRIEGNGHRIINKFRLNSNMIYIYEKADIPVLQSVLNSAWKNRSNLLFHLRKTNSRKKNRFYVQLKYIFNLAKKGLDKNIDIQCVVASHAEYEAYKKKVASCPS